MRTTHWGRPEEGGVLRETNAGGIGSIEHVTVVVRDLDRAMEHYTNDLGMGSWVDYTLSPDWIRDVRFRGKEHGYAYKLALCNVGPVLHELIESIQGPNHYEEYLNEHSEGVCITWATFVEDTEAKISNMESRGFSLLQSRRSFGTNDDGAYAQFDSERTLDCILEALELPSEMQPPERIYPEQS